MESKAGVAGIKGQRLRKLVSGFRELPLPRGDPSEC
jgi:hypothetical protein